MDSRSDGHVKRPSFSLLERFLVVVEILSRDLQLFAVNGEPQTVFVLEPPVG